MSAQLLSSAVAAPTAEECRLEVIPTIVGHFISDRHRIAGRLLDESLLILVLAGRGVYRLDGGRERRLATGDAVLLPAGRRHDFACDPQAGWEIRWVHFQGSYADSLARLAGFAGDRMVIAVGDDPAPAQRLQAIHERIAGRDQLSAAVELVGLLVALKKCDRCRLGEDARLLAAVEEGGGLPEMARTAGLSRFHFLRRFKRATGSTPWRYLLELRLARAKNLLIDPACSVAAAATAAGFADPAYFSRLFRKRTGITPREYRSRHCPLPG
jgi:AraC family transcriptional regulator of arabinose operon